MFSRKPRNNPLEKKKSETPIVREHFKNVSVFLRQRWPAWKHMIDKCQTAQEGPDDQYDSYRTCLLRNQRHKHKCRLSRTCQLFKAWSVAKAKGTKARGLKQSRIWHWDNIAVAVSKKCVHINSTSDTIIGRGELHGSLAVLQNIAVRQINYGIHGNIQDAKNVGFGSTCDRPETRQWTRRGCGIDIRTLSSDAGVRHNFGRTLFRNPLNVARGGDECRRARGPDLNAIYFDRTEEAPVCCAAGGIDKQVVQQLPSRQRHGSGCYSPTETCFTRRSDRWLKLGWMRYNTLSGTCGSSVTTRAIWRLFHIRRHFKEDRDHSD